jgi:hypothetical protein
MGRYSDKWVVDGDANHLPVPNTVSTNSLHNLAKRFLGHAVTVPRDRIYGMLSLITPESEYGRASPMIPGHAKSVETVYQEVPDLSCPLPQKLPQKGALLSLLHDQFSYSVAGKILQVNGKTIDAVSLARSPGTESGKHLVQMEQFHLFALDKRYCGGNCVMTHGRDK